MVGRTLLPADTFNPLSGGGRGPFLPPPPNICIRHVPSFAEWSRRGGGGVICKAQHDLIAFSILVVSVILCPCSAVVHFKLPASTSPVRTDLPHSSWVALTVFVWLWGTNVGLHVMPWKMLCLTLACAFVDPSVIVFFLPPAWRWMWQ